MMAARTKKAAGPNLGAPCSVPASCSAAKPVASNPPKVMPTLMPRTQEAGRCATAAQYVTLLMQPTLPAKTVQNRRIGVDLHNNATATNAKAATSWKNPMAQTKFPGRFLVNAL
mmetsp:Transcript_10386/g.24031  ORF Transcript_10386/g.24031 Transcript_10386/m.24031 type:complete len:114 (+) Transcript_10386:616-957(+)